MINLEKMAEKYRDAGYSERNADARVCQDIVLKAIVQSNLGRNVTIKGGVVMRSITGNVRRATEDLDLDFIRYSLEDESIRYFISKLNCLEGIRMEIKGNRIEQLSQQEYSGKREKDMNGVCKRIALTFSNRQFRRNVENSGDRNWLQIDVGVAFKMIQDFLETVNL